MLKLNAVLSSHLSITWDTGWSVCSISSPWLPNIDSRTVVSVSTVFAFLWRQYALSNVFGPLSTRAIIICFKLFMKFWKLVTVHVNLFLIIHVPWYKQFWTLGINVCLDIFVFLIHFTLFMKSCCLHILQFIWRLSMFCVGNLFKCHWNVKGVSTVSHTCLEGKGRDHVLLPGYWIRLWAEAQAGVLIPTV